MNIRDQFLGFTGGSVVKIAIAGDSSSIPDLGRSHMA